MKKKLIITLASLVGLVFIALLAIPLFLEGKIGEILKQNVNQNITGSFDFDKASLSLLSSFPNAQLKLSNTVLINETQFKGDTVFAASAISLKMGIMEIFKSAGEPIEIDRLLLKGGNLNLQLDLEENANYDLGRSENPTSVASENKSDFIFSLQDYEFSESNLTYRDEASGIGLQLSDVSHRGKGDFSLALSELITETEAKLSLEIDSIAYMKEIPLTLQAILQMDLENNKYTFKENQALLKDLELTFDGFVELLEDGQNIDINFNTPSSDFKDFLLLIPETYTKSLEGITTSGDFSAQGFVRGISNDEQIPEFQVRIVTEDAQVQYPELPLPIRDIKMKAILQNSAGQIESTQFIVENASFGIKEDRFELASTIDNLLGNKEVVLKVGAKMELANLARAYPVPRDLQLEGRLSADISSSFDMESVQKGQYQNTNITGELSLRDFNYRSELIPNPIHIGKLEMAFAPQNTIIKELSGKTGMSDFSIVGSLKNVLGYALGDEDLSGALKMNSDTFVVSDFQSPEKNTEAVDSNKATASNPEDNRVKIPPALDISMNTKANTVVYDNLQLREFKGDLLIKDEAVNFSNVNTSMLDGDLALNGSFNTRGAQPEFAMALDLKKLKIAEAFEAIELLEFIAPVAKALEGSFNSQLGLTGKLTSDFTPDLSSLSGEVLAEVLAARMDPERTPLLTGLNNTFSFIDLKKLDLNGLKTALSFENGKVRVKPFAIQYEDIKIQVMGEHGIDRSLRYELKMDVPANYLGSEVQGLLAGIGEAQSGEISIPVSTVIGGSASNPKITTDLSSGIKSLTQQLVAVQKEKMVQKGKDEAKSLLKNILKDQSDGKDSLQTNESATSASQILKKITQKDTLNTKKDSSNLKTNRVEETAKGLLKGLLSKKKKDTVQPKDSVN